jgi:hypothetical protein
LRILFIAFGSSSHTARWISQLSDQKWDLHLFPVDEYYLYPGLRDVTVHTLFSVNSKELAPSVRQSSLWWPWQRGRIRLGGTLQRLPGEPMSAPARLARLIRKLKPDIVHSMEMQHGAYLTLAGRERLNGSFPPWMYSSWGSDVYYFGKQPEHVGRIRAVLSACDYLMGDSQRDLDLAREFGFKGETLGVFPGAGGFEIDQMQKFRRPGPVAARRIIAVKGRQDLLGGRALVALQAIHLCADALGDYEIVVYMPQGDSIVTHAAQYIKFVTGLNIRVLPEHRPYEEILTMMGSARIAIGIGMTDGTPHSMLEAMVMGAFPIQSNTADTRGVIRDGENGLLVPPEDAGAIAAAIRRAVSDDNLVDQAGETNNKLTRERIDERIIKPRVIAAYQMVAANQKAKR